DDGFATGRLDTNRWFPYYLPHWSSRERARAHCHLDGGSLHLRIDQDQEPWCPGLDGEVRVSSLQTGVFSGPEGSPIGQHRFHPEAVVTEPQEELRLYTPQYGAIEVQARARNDPTTMVALWMIGFEERPEHSGEICVFEIFGSEVTRGGARVGMGIHPFGDPDLVDDFEKVEVAGDVREFRTYAVEWSAEKVDYFVDGARVKTSAQSPGYPMQLMLGIYEFERRPGDSYPKE